MTHLLCASENGYNTNYTTPDPKFVYRVSEVIKLIILGREWYNECLRALQRIKYYYILVLFLFEENLRFQQLARLV